MASPWRGFESCQVQALMSDAGTGKGFGSQGAAKACSSAIKTRNVCNDSWTRQRCGGVKWQVGSLSRRVALGGGRIFATCDADSDM
mgnify:CR=1 FL=1